jgi:LPS-assembly lipoprotein
MLLAATMLAGCTVQPLYGSGAGPSASGQSAALPAIGVDPVNTRQAQQVRNHLVFLFNGGAAEPANPAFRVKLSVSQRTVASATVQRTTLAEREPTAGRVIMNATYELIDGEGAVAARGTRQAIASFDQPVQQFAAERAERDAEDRAARELAEILRLAIAQDTVRPGR